MMIKFNVNDMVRVKLTDYGLECISKNHNRLYGDRAESFRDYVPTADENGWTKWQLWDLMHEFGPHLSKGLNNVPFETEIEILNESFGG